MEKIIEVIDMGHNLTTKVKIIGVGKEGRAVVKNISSKRDLSADFFVIPPVTQGYSKTSSESISFHINALEQEPNGNYIAFFIFSIDDLAAVETVISISKKIKNRGVLCTISSVFPSETNTVTKIELLQQHLDFVLTIPTKESFYATDITSVKFQLLAGNYYKPVYALIRVMEDKGVSNCYDWADFIAFANANKKTAFRYSIIRKEGDIQSDYEDALSKMFNFESLININSMVLKHALVYITAGDGFKPDDHEKIGNELTYLHDKGIVIIKGMSLDAEQPKDVIKIAMFLMGQDLIEDESDLFEPEECCFELPIPDFLK